MALDAGSIEKDAAAVIAACGVPGAEHFAKQLLGHWYDYRVARLLEEKENHRAAYCAALHLFRLMGIDAVGSIVWGQSFNEIAGLKHEYDERIAEDLGVDLEWVTAPGLTNKPLQPGPGWMPVACDYDALGELLRQAEHETTFVITRLSREALRAVHRLVCCLSIALLHATSPEDVQRLRAVTDHLQGKLLEASEDASKGGDV